MIPQPDYVIQIYIKKTYASGYFWMDEGRLKHAALLFLIPQLSCTQMDNINLLKTAEMLLEIWLRY